MDRLYVFLIRNDIWIYILSAFGLVWYLTEYWRSRRILKSAVFGLEKEKGKRIRQRAIFLIVLFLALISLLTYVNLSVAPTLPPELLKPPTPTPNIFRTPLSPPTRDVAQETPTIAIAPTVTLSGALPDGGSQLESVSPGDELTTPTITTTPQDPAIITGNCIPDVNITSPPDGTAVNELVTLFGSASGSQFESYYLETVGPETGGDWRPSSDLVVEPVRDGILGALDFTDWLPGTYFVRLTINSDEGSPVDQCTIELLVGVDPS